MSLSNHSPDHLHKRILAELKKHSGRGTTQSSSDSYLSSGHFYYDISVPVRRRIAKEWLKEHEDISAKEFLQVIDSLNRGKSYEEKTIASTLLGYHPGHRKMISLKNVDAWLGHLAGWAEIDSFCQNMFTADEMLADWRGWERLIRKLSRDKNINKRRAALVLLVGPVHYSDEKKIVALAFEMIEALKHEKPILITKAVSWLLRSMVTRHKAAVAAYIKKNAGTLPKIAVSETANKLKTGLKNGGKQKKQKPRKSGKGKRDF